MGYDPIDGEQNHDNRDEDSDVCLHDPISDESSGFLRVIADWFHSRIIRTLPVDGSHETN